MTSNPVSHRLHAQKTALVSVELSRRINALCKVAPPGGVCVKTALQINKLRSIKPFFQWLTRGAWGVLLAIHAHARARNRQKARRGSSWGHYERYGAEFLDINVDVRRGIYAHVRTTSTWTLGGEFLQTVEGNF